MGGLSPRVRGNRVDPGGGRPHRWSIPARAGEPLACWWRLLLTSVYPRACGGTGPNRREANPFWGLSPRVRGNRWYGAHRQPAYRSIPARAGEPWPVVGSCCALRVYPRACGGTIPATDFDRRGRGLSPRVRGNHCRPIVLLVSTRSIPARAGEPATRVTDPPNVKVYPRACGGTITSPLAVRFSRGLSPRVRGNRRPLRPCVTHRRSIPARAGEPSIIFAISVLTQVYPRACGGTANCGNTGAPS